MKNISFFTAVFLFTGYIISAQRFDVALDSFNSRNSAEKIYIHCDKDYYVAGETIWFKAYLYANGKPGGGSTNLFLQLTDVTGRHVADMMLPVMGAVAKGHIDLPDSLPQGSYFLRALTPAMLNRDESFIYKKQLIVLRPGSQAASPVSPNVAVQFFPESGHLIDGILTVVAFKAVDQWGTPADVNGTIKTEDGTVIASFKTYHDGIGKVQFKPQAGKKYLAEVITAAGPKTISLPEVSKSGINLKVQDEKGGKKFQLSRAIGDKSMTDKITLVAQINNMLVYENEIVFENYPSVIGHIITDSLPSGILHFTVFNSEGVPVAERLSFVDNGEYRSSAEINFTKTVFGKKEENQFELNFPAAVQRSLSVSVTDFSGTIGDKENIWSRYLLTSDLKGPIYNPAWYFETGNDSSKQGMDNLMLTHGWTKFSWTKILKGELPEKADAGQDFISVAGTVVDPKTKAALTGGRLNVLIEAGDSTTQQYEIPVDISGHFNLDSMFFNGKSKLFYAYINAKEKPQPALVIPKDDVLAKKSMYIPAEAIWRDGLNSAAWQSRKEVDERFRYVQSQLEEIKELQKVTVKARKKSSLEEVNEKYTSGVFRTDGKETIDNINNPVTDKTLNAVDYIRNRVQQLEIQGGIFVNRKNMSLMTGQKWAVGIFLNELPTNIGFLRTIMAKDIALVKFWEAGFVGVGSSFPGGAVAVYTKERFKEDVQPDKLEYFERNGYAVTKEFYSPDYNTTDAKKTSADNRTTLYWNPDVSTNASSGSVQLKFFNNDFSKKFKIVVEGFDADGKLIYTEKIIGD
jgi:hypothetical protein